MVMYGHTPVLLKETLDVLSKVQEPALMIDATLGLAGHAIAFLEHFPRLSLIGVDADASMLEEAEKRLFAYKERCTLVHQFFDEFFLNFNKGGQKADIILFDLGVSMVHFKEARRGFSLMEDEVLDMRLNTTTGRTALQLIEMSTERGLVHMLRLYGEEQFAVPIARAIIKARDNHELRTARELAELVKQTVPARLRYGKIHPATKTFQALRIAVNDELGRVERALDQAIHALSKHGCIGVISFHSLEDRIVKQTFMKYVEKKSVNKYAEQKSSKTLQKTPISPMGAQTNLDKVELELLVKKPITASHEEVKQNPASRSAKLRAVMRKG